MESTGFDTEILTGKTIASIGPVTSDTIRKYGVKVDIEAVEYTAQGLLESIKDFIS